VLQWSRGDHSAETVTSHSPRWIDQRRASMEPRRSLRGNAPRGRFYAREIDGFNGAAEITPRKPGHSSLASHTASRSLQWSRGDHSAETVAVEAHERLLPAEASMEPRRSLRGNRLRTRAPGRAPAWSFNGAAEITPRKRSNLRAVASSWNRRFNGAAEITPRKPVP